MKRIITSIIMAMVMTVSFAATYVVCGSGELLNGETWNTGSTVNVMTLQSDGTYQLVVENCNLEVGTTYSWLVYTADDGTGAASWYKDGGKDSGSDYTVTVAEHAMYTATFNFNESTGLATLTLEKTGEAEEVTHTYSIAGSPADIFGASWSETNTATEMSLNSDGKYEWTSSEVTLEASTSIQFKVVQDHAWGVAYPSSNYTMTCETAGTYTLTVTFDPTTKEVSATLNEATAEEVTTFEYKGITYKETTAPEGWEFGEAAVYKADYSGNISIGKAAANGENYYYVTAIDESAFAGCTELNSVSIANKVKEIGSKAFSGCTGLTAVDMSAYLSASGIPTLAADAFDESAYENVIIFVADETMLEAFKAADVWKNFKNIRLNSFVYNNVKYSINSDLTTVSASYVDPDDAGKSITTGDIVIPETVENEGTTYTVTAIEAYGFAEWYGLGVTSLDIPATVTKIGASAFAGNADTGTTVTTITVHWTEPYATEENDWMFINVGTKQDDGTYDRSSITLIVPDGTADAYKAAEVWKTFNIVEASVAGINSIQSAAGTAAIYDLNGIRLNGTKAGINIIRTADGKVKKVAVK